MDSPEARNLLETLKSELRLVETLGSEGTGAETLGSCALCEAAKSCLMCYGDPSLICPLKACVLISLVPLEYHSESVPCHYIPLTAGGEGIEALESWCTQRELEEFVKIWLRKTIKKMEADLTCPTATPSIISAGEKGAKGANTDKGAGLGSK